MMQAPRQTERTQRQISFLFCGKTKLLPIGSFVCVALEEERPPAFINPCQPDQPELVQSSFDFVAFSSSDFSTSQ